MNQLEQGKAAFAEHLVAKNILQIASVPAQTLQCDKPLLLQQNQLSVSNERFLKEQWSLMHEEYGVRLDSFWSMVQTEVSCFDACCFALCQR